MVKVLITIKSMVIIPRGSELSVPGDGRVGLGRPQGFLPGGKGDGSGLSPPPLAIHQGGSRSLEMVGSRWEGEALCAGPWAGLAAVPIDRNLGNYSGCKRES